MLGHAFFPALMNAIFVLLLCLGMLAYFWSYRKAVRLIRHAATSTSPQKPWHALPVHFGIYGFGRTIIMASLLWVAWYIVRLPLIEIYLSYVLPLPKAQEIGFFVSDLRAAVMSQGDDSASSLMREWVYHYRSLLSKGDTIAGLIVITTALYSLWRSLKRVSPHTRARVKIERWVIHLISFSAYISIAVTVLIFSSVVFEAAQFFHHISPIEFLFGTQWSPQTAIRADQAGASGLFGFLPLLAGTMLITLIALCVAVPIGLFAAIYMSEYANPRVRSIAKPMLEMLAGIPTVVYGFFAVMVVAPFLHHSGNYFGLDIASESALAAGLVMALTIIPLVSSLSDDAMKAVPQSLRDASYAMGATHCETITRVVLPAALSGIMGGVLLAASRAIGETMIVVMAAGLAANLTFNPLESVTTITVQIVALLVGDQEFGSTKTLAAFALGLTLFIATLILNILALFLVRRYRQVYE
jgi:phosphate transport system permease protein